MPNIERLKTLLEYVKEIPTCKIEMSYFRCETAACLMGYAVDIFPNRFKWTWSQFWWAPLDMLVGPEHRRGQSFFDLSDEQWDAIFEADIPNDQAVENLRDHIERWSNAQH